MTWLGIAIRLGLYLDLMLLFGIAAFGLYTAGLTDSAPTGAKHGALAFIALAGLVLSGVYLVDTVASMSGVDIAHVDRRSIGDFLLSTAAGLAWLVRVAALALVLVGTAAPRRPMLLISVAGGGIALGSLAWGGHGAAGDGAMGIIHLAANIVHLLAAGIWVGALVVFAGLFARPATRSSDADVRFATLALTSFGPIGAVAVALITASGIVNSWVLVGPAHFGDLFASLYGRLLSLKLALFAAMVLLAASNRYLRTPSLAAAVQASDQAAAMRALRTSIALEAGCAALVLALVAWLGTLEPPISA